MPITTSELRAIIDGIGPAIAKAIHDETAVLQQRVRVLEQKAMRYCGTYQRVQTYMRGDTVTHQGGMWVATRDDVTEAPGTGNAWQLTSKSHA